VNYCVLHSGASAALAKHLHLIGTNAVQRPDLGIVWVAERIGGFAKIASAHGVDGLGCQLPVGGIIFLNGLDHCALNGHPCVRIRRVHQQQRHVAPKPQIPVFLAAACRVQQDVRLVAADLDRAGTDCSVAVYRGHARRDWFI
jgi:hypothetical protein